MGETITRRLTAAALGVAVTALGLAGCATSGPSGAPAAQAQGHRSTGSYGVLTYPGGSGHALACSVAVVGPGTTATPLPADAALPCPTATGPAPAASIPPAAASPAVPVGGSSTQPVAAPSLAAPSNPNHAGTPATPKQPADVTQFLWAEGEPLSSGACVDLVRGLSPAAALRAMYPHPATPIESDSSAEAWMTGESANDRRGIAVVAQAHARDGWTIVYVRNGFDCQDATVPLSRHGVAAAVYMNGDGNSSGFAYSAGGHLRSAFDPYYGPSDDTAHKPLPQAKGIPWGKGLAPYLAQAVALIHRLTGFALQETDLRDGATDVAIGVFE